MGKPEDNLVKRIVDRVRKQYPSAYILKTHGGGMQRGGIPDLFIVIRGVFFALEVKRQQPGESEASARSRATLLQLAEIEKIRTAGGISSVVISVEEALEEISKGLDLSP